MDFITDLPPSKGKMVLWVGVDMFSKQAHFVPCASLTSAKALAKLFLSHIFKLHGFPETVVSDRGSALIANFWKEFLQLVGVQWWLSSSYHPQSEHLNQILEGFLRCYTSFQQDNWVEFLSLVEYAYNNSLHSSTGAMPFQVVQGLDEKPLPKVPSSSVHNPELLHWSGSLTEQWDLIKKSLDLAKQHYKKFAERKRGANLSLKPGDFVYIS